MSTKVGRNTFSGTANVFNGTLSEIVMSLAAGYARMAMSRDEISPLGNPNAIFDKLGVTPMPTVAAAPEDDMGVGHSDFLTVLQGHSTALDELLLYSDTLASAINLTLPVLPNPYFGGSGAIPLIEETLPDPDLGADLVSVRGANLILTEHEAMLHAVVKNLNTIAAALGMSAVAGPLKTSYAKIANMDWGAPKLDTDVLMHNPDDPTSQIASSSDLNGAIQNSAYGIVYLVREANTLSAPDFMPVNVHVADFLPGNGWNTDLRPPD